MGGVEGPPLFRVHGGLFIGEGRIVVADASAHRILVFDGATYRTLGREGDGPGEYRGIASLDHWMGDSVAVYDAVARRVTVASLEVNGGVRTIDIPLTGPAPYAVLPVDRDRFVIVEGARIGPGDLPAGHQRLSAAVYVWSSGQGRTDTIASVPTYHVFVPERGGFVLPPVPRLGRVARAGEDLALFDGGRPEVRILSAGSPARPEVRIRIDGFRDRVDDGIREVLSDSLIRQAENRTRMRRTLELVGGVDSLPGIGTLKGTTSGLLWASEVALPISTERRWVAFDVREEEAWSVVLPTDAEVLDHVADKLLLLRTSELGEERVEVRPMESRLNPLEAAASGTPPSTWTASTTPP